MQIEIVQSDFVAWKNDKVTKFIFKYLEDVSEFYLEKMTSKELISNPNGLLRLNELRGYVDAIQDILHLDPIEEQTIEEVENEKSNSARI